MQKTIRESVSAKGVGLHTGHPVTMTFKPLGPDMGVVFQRVDLSGKPMIKADIHSLLAGKKNPRRTTLFLGDVEVQTIEHLMAAFGGLGISNILVELDKNEVPCLDGSARSFVELIKKAGIVEQGVPRRVFKVRSAIWAHDEDSVIAVLPSSEFKISYTLSYPQPSLGDQFLEVTLTPEVFEQELVGARTFCLAEEADALIKSGLGKGANYENTLVVGKEGIEKNCLRYDKEFIRHKILDLIGDFHLLGVAIKGHVIAVKSGHTLNTRILEKMRDQMAQQALVGVRSVAGMDTSSAIDATAIMKILPHRYPFLLVDRVVSLEEGKRCVGIKNVSINENFFQGHFPSRPVMPGVLIIEAMAQLGGVLMLSPRQNRGKMAFFMAANNIKFRKPVVPGDQLVLEVEVGKLRSKTGQVITTARVDGDVVAEAELMFALVES